MIREGDIREKLFPDFPDMKVNFAEIGIGKIGKIGLAPPPKIAQNSTVKKDVDIANLRPSPRLLAHLHVQFHQTLKSRAHLPWFHVLFVMISPLKIKTR